TLGMAHRACTARTRHRRARSRRAGERPARRSTIRTSEMTLSIYRCDARSRWLLLMVSLAACSSNQEARKPAGTPVRIAIASRLDAPVTLTSSGMVEPMQTVAVTAKVSGTLLDVVFREGDFVTPGQVLF